MDEILIVEDDKDIQKLLSLCFEQEALPYSVASTGKEAIEQVKKRAPSLILLDMMLPDIDGILVCQQLRMLTTSPILFVTCKNGDNDKILGLSIGADDYIEKPFNISVLLARVRAHLRRNRMLKKQQAKQDQSIHFDHMIINASAREVLRDGKKIHLTAKEFDLLHFLTQHPNQVFSPEQLLDKIWGIDSFGEKRTVIVHMSSLRKKIEEDPLNPRYIVTVRGVGYKFVEAANH
ncbi:response regulator transcription factor [Brevibacillus massiliensis]|uniref:response regulator transcription factor n=1 Tax=Brevibacillus massiliensis TaxID=1118054 RepID=UPI00031EEED5|nr:response regulator transcription factor [Brevibacillus massiliensis]